ncbi:pyrroloquinoline quinone biosynthesis peptide chaperone PqqD [Bradyrhizobium sp. LHD-71]|uniref:pyrroloquinoline quinone biosynthesis peptide chaperone PqqD n=1 Tax=Bradyrhizobium sp. LHD-71 TaxID=3072141 RepID=UPI00280DE3A7|nr:pyrroloquinoline quinone biosynthesis peptide chaperone PqqD [Bradyrhizobium sp. LHD-71]MDQ8727172.1 pyrroloquinoline quinone biosynthesis peptide chaperone PqqD [Bradyrhizobium sp. LHD-71]
MSIEGSSKPRLADSATLRWDKVRDKWVLQSPERLFFPDDVAVSVISLCDGQRTLQSITDELAREFDAPATAIYDDTVELLKGLAAEGVIVHDAGPR